MYTGGGRFDFVRGESSVDMTVEYPAEGDFRVIVDRSGIYIRSAELEKKLSPGKQWVELGRKEVEARRLDIYPFVREDPILEFEFLLRQTPRVEDLGIEVVQDEEARHYRMTVSMRRIESVLGNGDQGVPWWSRFYYAALIRQLGTKNPLVVDMWIDETGRVVREATAFRMMVYTEQPPAEATMKLVFDYFQYAKDRTASWVTRPPPQRIADASVLREG